MNRIFSLIRIPDAVQEAHDKITKTFSWVFYSRKYTAPLDQDEHFWISPDEINRGATQPPTVSSFAIAGVRGGEWDQNIRLFSEDVVYTSFKEHFLNNEPWENTDYYKSLQERVESNGQFKDCDSEADIRKRCNRLDRLFESIRENGYSRQRVLDETSTAKIESLDLEKHVRPEYREIGIDIGRDGEILYRDGTHRLAIAKILDIDIVPVRVKVRHKQWQETLDQLYQEGDDVLTDTDATADHPDVKRLLGSGFGDAKS